MTFTGELVLASGSPRRSELLSSLGLKFTVHPSSFDESSIHEASPAALVERLALAKARTVMDTITAEDVVVIGADTVVVGDDEVLGKPGHVDDAARMLRQLQGRAHWVYSGLCVMRREGNPTVEPEARLGHGATRVTMRTLSDETIARYIATGEPMDKAGAYAIQGLGATLITSIQGDYFTVVGLPLHLLAEMLATYGITVF